MVSASKTEIYLFYLFIIGGYYLPSEFSLFLAALGIVVSLLIKPLKRDFVKSIILPVFLIGLGLINAYKNPKYDSFRDLYYFTLPVLVFCFGYLYAYHITIKSFFKSVKALGFIMALLYLGQYDFNANYSSVMEMKEEEGVASYMVVFALFLKIFEMKKIKLSFTAKDFLMVLLLSFVCVISFSRTFILIFVVLYVFGMGLLAVNKYFLRRVLGGILVITLVIIMILNIKSNDRSTFIGKLKTSVKELAISNYVSKTDINSNWRGFEAFKGVQQILRGNIFELIVGQGFGASAPLGIKMKLGDASFSKIPKFHNGYITVLLKTGILGFMVYICFFVRNIIVNLKDLQNINTEYTLSKNLIAALSIVILLSTVVISGWLNTGTFLQYIFFLGYFMSVKKQLLKINNE